MTNITFESLSEQINSELQQDIQLAPYGLKARIYENGTVQIQGIVDVLAEKHQAEELVRRFPSVKNVENNITICTDGGIDDEDVAFEVGEELHANPGVPDSVGVKVTGGEVKLVGNVQNRDEALEALETASKARGVREVHSQLKLVDNVDDVDIVNGIQTALLTELEIPSGKVKVSSKSGIVTLDGNLANPQAAIVEGIASRQPGVRDVKNRLGKEE